jgi:hypothetical protein
VLIRDDPGRRDRVAAMKPRQGGGGSFRSPDCRN